MTDWQDKLVQFGEYVRCILLTDGEFSTRLSDLVGLESSPVSGFTLEWKNPINGNLHTFGKPGDGPADFRDTDEPCVTIQAWARKDGGRPTISPVSEVARKIWSSCANLLAQENLHPISGLRNLKGPKRVQQMAEQRFLTCMQTNQRCALLFFDLDNFGQVNKLLDHEKGDIAIKRFANFLVEVCRQSVALLHNGGDEFLGFYPDADPEDAIDLVLEILASSKGFDFQSQNIPVSVSIGIACYPGVQGCESFSDFVKAADAALRSVKDSTKKGTARFSPISDVSGPLPSHTEHAAKLATCLIKSSVGSSPVRMFSSPWLNVLAEGGSRALSVGSLGLSDLQKLVDDFVGAAQLEINNAILTAHQSRDSGVDTRPLVSWVDVGIALANGIFHAAARHVNLREKVSGLTIRFTDVGASLVTAKDAVLWTGGCPLGEQFRTLDLGSCWGSDDPSDLDSEAGRMAILAQIGHQDLGIPTALLAGRVIIDDRPTRGGGLPDFWELTLERIFVQLNSYPNITKIFVMGDSRWGKQSLKWLTNTDEWDDRYIARKTTLSLEIIQGVKTRLAGNVHVVGNLDEMVDVLLPVAQTPRSLHRRPVALEPGRRTGFLRRDIHMNDMQLRHEDGCRVSTIAEAYVVVLELLRRQSDQSDPILDQAGQPLTEFMDFKVELSDPLKDTVPDFYKADQSQLEEYYSREFQNEGGIFQEPIRKDGQYDKVVAHITETLSMESSPHTRRAILVIPNMPSLGRALAPLGLVAIRCIPEITGQGTFLHFSYVWRTVEALVGFPYSLYGSVRFASDFATEVKNILAGEGKSVIVKLGRVSYIALNLHMFRDEGALEIARRIVNDASM